jgi:hypothetical protein
MSQSYQNLQQHQNGGQPDRSPVHVGHRGFTSDATNDNRGDGHMSHSHDHSSISSYQQPDPYAWVGGYGGYDPYGYMYGYGGYDPYGYGYFDPGTNVVDPQTTTAAPEQWGEAQQTDLASLEEQGAVREYEEGSVLVIANGPEDMRKLDHGAEADMISSAMGSRQTVVLWNPSAEALQAMLKQGNFKDVVLSGHGSEGNVFMTGADGKSVAVDAKTFTGYFQDTAVQNVFLNMCHGAGGQNSVAQSLAEANMNVLGWQTTVKDDDAKNTAAAFGSLLADGTDLDDMNAAAQMNSNLTVIAAQQPGAATAPTTETAPATPAVAAGPTPEQIAADELAAQQAAAMQADQEAIAMAQWSAQYGQFMMY